MGGTVGTQNAQGVLSSARSDMNTAAAADEDSPEVGSPPPPAASPWWRSGGFGFALIAGAVAFAYRALRGYDPYAEVAWGDLDFADAAFFSPQAASPEIILPLAGYLLFNRRHRLFASLGAPPANGLGALFAAVGAALYAWSHWTAAIDLRLVSLVFALLALGALFGGREGLRAIRRPALFLLLLVPIPPTLNNAIVYEMQLFTAESTHQILQWIGMRSDVSGDLILTETRIFKVIESCTGIRSVHTLLMAAIVYTELFERGRRTLFTLMLLSPLIAMVANQIRVLTLVFNPYSDIASVHLFQGLAMIAVGTLMLAGVDALLTRLAVYRDDRAEALFPARAYTGARRPLALRTALVTASLLGLGLLSGAPQWEPAPDTAPRLGTIPGSFDGWLPRGLSFDHDFLGTTYFDQRIFREYVRDEESVTLMVATNPHSLRMASLVSEKTALPETGWWIDGRRSFGWDPVEQQLREGDDLELLTVRRGAERRVVLHWYRGDLPLAEAVLREGTALDRSQWGRPGRALVVTLGTPADGEPAEVRGRLVGVLRSLLPALERVGADPPPGASAQDA